MNPLNPIHPLFCIKVDLCYHHHCMIIPLAKREIHGCPILKLSQQIGAPLPPPCLAPSACVDDLHFPFHVPPSFGPGGLKFGENCSEAGSFRDPSFGTSRLTKENMTKIHQ